MMRCFLFALFMAMPLIVHATPYKINHDQSTITFTGTHAGNEFNGTFTDWSATIDFDEQNLDHSTATITINTASAETDNAMYDGTLPTTDWFDTDTYPAIKFTAHQFDKTMLGFNVTGDLQIKDKTRTETFDFNLDGLSPKTVTATFPIDRLSYDIGKKSDPSAEWVGENINVQIKFVTK